MEENLIVNQILAYTFGDEFVYHALVDDNKFIHDDFKSILLYSAKKDGCSKH